MRWRGSCPLTCILTRIIWRRAWYCDGSDTRTCQAIRRFGSVQREGGGGRASYWGSILPKIGFRDSCFQGRQRDPLSFELEGMAEEGGEIPHTAFHSRYSEHPTSLWSLLPEEERRSVRGVSSGEQGVVLAQRSGTHPNPYFSLLCEPRLSYFGEQ